MYTFLFSFMFTLGFICYDFLYSFLFYVFSPYFTFTSFYVCLLISRFGFTKHNVNVKSICVFYVYVFFNENVKKQSKKKEKPVVKSYFLIGVFYVTYFTLFLRIKRYVF